MQSQSFGWGASRKGGRPNFYDGRFKSVDWEHVRNKRGGGGGSNNFRVRKDFRGSARKIQRVVHNKRKSDSHNDGISWYRVFLPKSFGTTKEHIAEQVTALVGPVTLYYYHKEKENAVFFVQGLENADALRACSRRIQDMKGVPLSVHVTESDQMPMIPINRFLEEQIVEALRRRFHIDSKFLDLSDFAHDQGLLNLNLYVPLSRESIFPLVMKKVKDHFSDLIALGLSNNRLWTLAPLSSLASSCHELRALDLSNNKVRAVTDISVI